MTTAMSHLRAERHEEIGHLIVCSVDEIIRRWTERAQVEQPNAKRVHRDVLMDHLPEFLSALGRCLATSGDDTEAPRRQASDHGDQRWDTGWSINELVRDYQILRVVLTEYLEQALARRLQSRESLVLNDVIDEAISASVQAFAASQTAPGTAPLTTRGQALDLLLNVLGLVGHELRNPLAPLANSLEILRIMDSDPDQLENIRQLMGRQLKILTRLVEDLMDLPRLARGKMSIVRERVDLGQLLRSCVEDRRTSLEGIELTIRLDVPQSPVWLIGDETRLIQAFGNLIGNSQKFTEPGGLIVVQLQMSSATHATVTISDTGVGIDPTVLPHIFEAYTQADRTVGRSRGGLGLGLALVKGVIELHGGSVVAMSNGLGTGTTVTVQLPLDQSVAPALPALNTSKLSPVTPRKVLVIEDNRDSAESLKIFLELHGHSVWIAESGPEAFNISRTVNPEVVVCDIGLPGMNGYEVAARLRETILPAPLLIIALSGGKPREGSEGEPDSIFEHYLLKPADPARIERLISSQLRFA